MLCTSCGQTIKPVVAVDIDGTLGDYHGHFIRFCEQYFGRKQKTHWVGYGGSIPFSLWCEGAFDITLEQFREAKLAYRQGGMKRSMPMFPGARLLCWLIQNAGAELWLTTTRPYLSLDGIVKDTHEWLKRHLIEMDGLLFDDDKYRTLAERVDPERVVAILDDLPENLNVAAEVFGTHVPILVLGKYNYKVHAQIMVDLDSAADVVLQRIWAWQGMDRVAS